MSSYAQKVLSGYNQISVRGGDPNVTGEITSRLAPRNRHTLSRFTPRNLPKFIPANRPYPLQVPVNLSYPPRVPKRVWRRLLRTALRRWPIVGFGIEWYADYHSEFPGFGNITPGWRAPVVGPAYAPGDYVPNPFDHGAFDNPPESLLDTSDTTPFTIRYWGDHGTNPYADGAPRPYILPEPLRFDQNSPLTQNGPHPLAENIPRYTPTVNVQKDYVTQAAPAPARLPAQVFQELMFMEPMLRMQLRRVQKPRPHTKARPKRNKPNKLEIKMQSRVSRILSNFYDAEEVVQIFGDALKIIMQPDWFRLSGRHGWRYNNKAERLRNLFAQEIAENLIIQFIRKKGGRSAFDDRWMFR